MKETILEHLENSDPEDTHETIHDQKSEEWAEMMKLRLNRKKTMQEWKAKFHATHTETEKKQNATSQ